MPEAELQLVDALNDIDQQRLRHILGRAQNLIGERLTPAVRAQIIAAVATPSQPTWENVYSTIINTKGQTVWQAVIAHTDFPVRKRRDSNARWPITPTRRQILIGLELGTR